MFAFVTPSISFIFEEIHGFYIVLDRIVQISNLPKTTFKEQFYKSPLWNSFSSTSVYLLCFMLFAKAQGYTLCLGRGCVVMLQRRGVDR